MLIHENDLAGLFLDDILKGYKKMGWEVIDAKEAIEQPAFNVQLKTLQFSLLQGAVHKVHQS